MFTTPGDRSGRVRQINKASSLNVGFEQDKPSFEFRSRTAVTSFPVPSLRPRMTNTVLALDIMPNGTPAESSGNGYAWFDICDTDVMNGDPAVAALHMSARSTKNVIGSRVFNGASLKPLEFQMGTTAVGEITAAGAWKFYTADNFGFPLTCVGTSAGSGGPFAKLYHNSASPANGDSVGGFSFCGNDSGGNETFYSQVAGYIVDTTDGSEDGGMIFQTMVAGSFSERMKVEQGVQVGSPTGGDKGVGNINAKAVYDDNVLLTDLVLDLAVDGTWDKQAYAKHPLNDALSNDWLDPSTYEALWRKNRHLPGMISWLDEANRPSMGEIITRLTGTVEILSVHIAKLNERLAVLEEASKNRP